MGGNATPPALSGPARRRRRARLIGVGAAGLIALTGAVYSGAPRAAAATASQRGNPGTNFMLPLSGTVTVSGLPTPSSPASPPHGGVIAPSPGRAPAVRSTTSGNDLAVAPRSPAMPTLANALEQEFTTTGLVADNFAPPDTQVASGGTEVVEETNLEGRVLTRGGGVLKTFRLADFYAPVTATQLSDPRVVFDPGSGRWFMSIITVPALSPPSQNQVFMAASTTSDATGTWNIYLVEGPLPVNRFADQARLGFSSDKVTIAFEDFDTSHTCFPASSCHDDILWAIELADVTSGITAHATRFNTTNGFAHPFGIVPAIPLAGAETTTAYAAYNETHTGGHNVAILVITGLPSAGTTAYVDLETGISGTSAPPPAHQPGGNQNIDTGDDRFLSASVGRALGGEAAEIWVTGGDKCSPGGTDQACVRALRVQTDSGGTTLTRTWQQEISATGQDLYYPAICGDSAGTHAFITYTISSSTRFPTSEVMSVFPGSASQNDVSDYATGTQAYLLGVDPNHNNLSRWGDYSGIYPDDPSGDTVWLATEFGAVAGGDWATQIAQYTIEPPVVTSVGPIAAPAGTTVAILGANFTQSSFVAFGATPVASVGFLSSGELVVSSPTHPEGTVDITVTTLKGTSPTTVNDRYTYPAMLWASLTADHAVSLIDTGPVGGFFVTPLSTTSAPAGIATLPDDSEALVVDHAGGLLIPVAQLTHAAGPPVAVGTGPLDVAVAPGGHLAYVTGPHALRPVRIMANGGLTALAPIPIAGAVRLTGIAITPDASRAYVTDPTAGKVWMVALNSSGGGALAGSLSMDFPTGIAISGSVGFVTIDLGPSSTGLVITFDTGSNTTLDAVGVGRDPRRVAVTPAGDYVYVTNTADGTVTGIHHTGPGSDSVIGVVPVGTAPVGVALTPDGTTGFTANSGDGSIGFFGSPLGPPFGTVPSGGSNPVQLAMTVPQPIACGAHSVTPLLLSATPASVTHSMPYTEEDQVGFCGASSLTETVTVKTVYTKIPTGCGSTSVGAASWVLNLGQNARFTQRPAPACPGAYTLRVQLFDPTNTLVDSASIPLQVN